MTNEPCDDQMTFDLADLSHDPVTESDVMRFLHVFFIVPIYEVAYDQCVKFFEPLSWECEIIEKVVRDWCKTN